MPDLTSVTDNYFTQNSETYSDNLSSSILALAATVPVNSSSPYSDGDQVVLTVEPGTANQATFTGTVSGNSYINCVWTEGNLAVGHNTGKTVTDYDSATHFAMLTKGIQQEHDADGTHGAITPTSITVGGQSFGSLVTGWLEAAETWTYASATTFTVTGDVRTKYPTGTRLRLIQSSSTKYFVVISTSYSSNTTITVNTTTDYSLTNVTISSPYYSYFNQPQGFPSVFNYTPTYGNLSGGATTTAHYTIVGKWCDIYIKYTLAGANISGAVTFTTPAAMSSAITATNEVIMGSVNLVDTGTAAYGGYLKWATSTTITIQTLGSAGSYINATDLSSTVPHTWANTDVISVRARVLLQGS